MLKHLRNLFKSGKTQAIEELESANSNESESNTDSQSSSVNSINLSDLKPSNSFVIDGIKEQTFDGGFGSVSSGGDVNGDGFDDIIISAPGADSDGKKPAGETYVIFGSENLASSSNLSVSELNGRNGFVIKGINEYGGSGISLSSSGDVNGDGIDDIVLSAPFSTSDDLKQTGESYVIFGDENLASSGSLSLSELNGRNGFIVEGIDVFDRSGISVSSAGDVNGDGIDDIVIGAPGVRPYSSGLTAGLPDTYSANDPRVGESYVIFGGNNLANSGSLSASELNGTNGFVIKGNSKGDYFGHSVSSAGDVNGDGIDDIVIGAKYAGKSYVIFGSANHLGNSTLSVSELNGRNGFAIEKMGGDSVSNGGDINGDGIDDIVIGYPFGDPDDKSDAGESYVILGEADLGSSGSLSVSELEGSNGFILKGIDERDYFGHSVSSAGDVNGDGIDDIAISAPGADPNSNTTYVIKGGEGYIVFGSANIGSSGVVEMSKLDGGNGLILKDYGSHIPILSSDAGDDSTNNSISIAGDVNSDGIADIIIGVPAGYGTTADSYIIFGSRDHIINSLDSNNNHPKQITNSNSLIEGQSLVVALFICLNLLSMLVRKQIFIECKKPSLMQL